MIVQDMYDRLATITGFPKYTNDVDMPETNRFLLETLSESLRSLVSKMYVANNVLEKTDTLTTTKGQSQYGVEGIIKHVQVIDPSNRNKTWVIPYNNNFNKDLYIDDKDNRNQGEPESYVIKNGYLRLLPTPDKAYKVIVTLSSTDLVWKNDDTSSQIIDSVKDTVMTDTKFCDLIILNAAVLIFSRCRNQNAEVFSNLFKESFDRYIEEDYGTFQAIRGFGGGRFGNYDSDTGLLG